VTKLPDTFNQRFTGSSVPGSIREELARVLSSHEFRSSKRVRVPPIRGRVLSMDTDLLKERTIGIEVFGRSTVEPAMTPLFASRRAMCQRLSLYASRGFANRRIELPGAPMSRVQMGVAWAAGLWNKRQRFGAAALEKSRPAPFQIAGGRGIAALAAPAWPRFGCGRDR
jgi:hypothetical protein